MKEEFYFIDTRDDAKSDKPFAIHNKDVAKSWKKEYNNGEGPFKPVEAPNGSEDQSVEKEENDRETENSEASDNNFDVSAYDGMKVDELKGELDGRFIDYPSKATKPELIKLLVEDDKTGGE